MNFVTYGYKKYHNITIEEIVEKYPKEILESPEWFKLFPCTQEQHDEWVEETKQLLKKKYKLNKWMIERGWGFLYLNTSPYVSDSPYETK